MESLGNMIVYPENRDWGLGVSYPPMDLPVILYPSFLRRQYRAVRRPRLTVNLHFHAKLCHPCGMRVYSENKTYDIRYLILDPTVIPAKAGIQCS